jgi:hypothetical protein
VIRRLCSRLSYANVVATLALFLALGGSAVAASQINGSAIKNRSIAGGKLKKNTLTGTEINKAKLGTVPHATLADRATSATRADQATTAASPTVPALTSPESSLASSSPLPGVWPSRVTE